MLVGWRPIKSSYSKCGYSEFLLDTFWISPVIMMDINISLRVEMRTLWIAMTWDGFILSVVFLECMFIFGRVGWEESLNDKKLSHFFFKVGEIIINIGKNVVKLLW